MGVEVGTYISDLVTTNPGSTDFESQGDDHLRLIKATLKQTFLDTFTAGIYLPKMTSAANALILSTLKNFGFGVGMLNGTLSASVAANALTINVKTLAGTDPSASDPVYVIFRSATPGSGSYSILTLTAVTSLVLSAGSTLGTANSVAFRLWVVGFNDGGTFRLGVINARSGLNVYPLRDELIVNSTAEGGLGAADSAWVFYSGAAVASKALKILGYLEWSAGLATAGSWASVPTGVQLFGAGVSRPGDRVQLVRNDDGSMHGFGTVIPDDDTVPQITEGTEVMTQAITPTSAANLLQVRSQVVLASDTTADLWAALFRDAIASALSATNSPQSAVNFPTPSCISHRVLAGGVAATTFRLRAGKGGGVGNVTMNGYVGTRVMGGVMNSFLEVEEIMS